MTKRLPTVRMPSPKRSPKKRPGARSMSGLQKAIYWNDYYIERDDEGNPVPSLRNVALLAKGEALAHAYTLVSYGKRIVVDYMTLEATYSKQRFDIMEMMENIGKESEHG